MVYLKYGNFLRRVPLERVFPDIDEEEIRESTFLEPEDEETNVAEDIPPNLLQQDFDIASENLSLRKELENLKENLDEKLDEGEKGKKRFNH